jgi:hypothetical protein
VFAQLDVKFLGEIEDVQERLEVMAHPVVLLIFYPEKSLCQVPLTYFLYILFSGGSESFRRA